MTDETRATAKVLLDKHGPDASMQALTRAEECWSCFGLVES